MALVESVNINPGTSMPDFSLSTPDGTAYSTSSAMGEKGLLVAFTCNHCPYAIAIWPRLIACATWAESQGIHTVAINPNIHPSYPEDDPTHMLQRIEEWGIPFPYLIDQEQEVAAAYQAQCTPDLYLLDANQCMFYHGRLDDSWQDETLVSQQDLQQAMEHLIHDKMPPEPQHPSMGCSIKWQ